MNKKIILKFALIFIVVLTMILGAMKFGGDFLRGRDKREELVITPPLVFQPEPVMPEKKKEETPQEKLEKLKKEIEENPRDIVKRAQLANLYFLEGKIALSLLEYKKIIALAPKSNEEKEALNWIDKQQYTALSEWKNTLSKKFQEPALLLEYGRLSEQLSTISQKFTQDISPTTTLSPTLQAPAPTLPGPSMPTAVHPPTSLTPPYIITYPPAATQYYPYLQQYLTPQIMPQPTLR